MSTQEHLLFPVSYSPFSLITFLSYRPLHSTNTILGFAYSMKPLKPSRMFASPGQPPFFKALFIRGLASLNPLPNGHSIMPCFLVSWYTI